MAPHTGNGPTSRLVWPCRRAYAGCIRQCGSVSRWRASTVRARVDETIAEMEGSAGIYKSPPQPDTGYWRRYRVSSRHHRSARQAAPSNPSATLVSACLIVRDEAEMLPDCLASIRGVADEIVVVDTGSTDATTDIARKAGARVYHFEWCDDFAAARNAALDHARGRWVLQIDADERLTALGGGPVDSVSLRRWLTNPPPQALAADGITLSVRNVGEGVTDRAPANRLFLRHSGRRYVRRIHETPFPGDTSWRLFGLVDIELLHIGYAPEVQGKKGKHERNLRLCELAVRERPDDAEIHYYCGFELDRARRKVEALSHFAEAWNRMPPWLVGGGIWWKTLVALCEGLNTGGSAGLVLRLVVPLLERFPNVAHLHFLRGDALRLLGRSDEALACLHAALVLPPAGVAFEPSTTKCYCWSAIGVIHELAGRLDPAVQAYRQSLALGPTPFAESRLAALQVTMQPSSATSTAC